MNYKRIEAVMFDFDGTLRTNIPRGVDAFHDYAHELGVETTHEQRQHAWRWTYEYWAGPAQDRVDQLTAAGEAEGESFWIMNARLHLREMGAAEASIPRLAREIVQMFNDQYTPEDVLLPGVPQALRALREAGLRLAVVSNRGEPFDDELEKLGINGAFDYALAAGEIGIWKPEPGVLLHAAAKLGVQPEAVVYIGDNYYADVKGAQAAGMQAILVDIDGNFPDADCPAMTHFDELPAILDRLDS